MKTAHTSIPPAAAGRHPWSLGHTLSHNTPQCQYDHAAALQPRHLSPYGSSQAAQQGREGGAYTCTHTQAGADASTAHALLPLQQQHLPHTSLSSMCAAHVYHAHKHREQRMHIAINQSHSSSLHTTQPSPSLYGRTTRVPSRRLITVADSRSECLMSWLKVCVRV